MSFDRTLAIAMVSLALGACGLMPQRAPTTAEPGAQPAATSAPASEPVPAQARTEFARALTAMRAGRDAEAAQRLQALAAAYPDLGGIQANLGLIHARAGRSKDAEQAFTAAVRISPEQPAYYNLLGVFQREQGEFVKARKAYEQALSHDPAYGPAHLNLAILYDIYLWEPDKAMIHYEQYRQLVPESAPQVTKWLADIKARQKAERVAKGDN